ncbi:uncharacterized protein LOC111392318 [Olea europaea var. sylvestris]|uniref:F-box domain, cyclin n=1 Tax=Olea europaea subsp. europaea TaxID=158383 RepID=A0A8S0V8P8_OLEEU|nr:uncharacterized protein LOC111392318 [Olea europaea var. sylvestris]CAA3027337.1 F-box domain, cyclin [Olea europaea subsp. europaea]
MSPSQSIQNSLPHDISLKIASSLQVFDVCSLGSCSRFWRELCGSDCVWEALCKDRWPARGFDKDYFAFEDQNFVFDKRTDSNLKGWRELYINKHNEMAEKASLVMNFVERALAYESIEVGNYLKAIEFMKSMQFGFEDVQMFFLKPKLNVLFNLVGLHYCIIWLDVPSKYVMEALHSNEITERQVCVQWWKLGRWFHGFRLRDELHSRSVSLGDLASSNEEVLGVLHRGAIHEVLRVQISAVKPTSTSWSHQVAQSE